MSAKPLRNPFDSFYLDAIKPLGQKTIDLFGEDFLVFICHELHCHVWHLTTHYGDFLREIDPGKVNECKTFYDLVLPKFGTPLEEISLEAHDERCFFLILMSNKELLVVINRLFLYLIGPWQANPEPVMI